HGRDPRFSRGETLHQVAQGSGSRGDFTPLILAADHRLDRRGSADRRRDRTSLPGGCDGLISIHDERPRSLRSLIKGYRALMHTSWSVMLQYRAAVFTWTLWSLAVPIVQLSVWSAIIAVEGGMDGYDRENIIAYFLLQSIVFHMTTAWHVYEFSEYIRSGTLSMWLLRPFDPSHQFVTSNLSFKFVNLIWLTPIWIGLWVYFRPGITYSAARVVAFALGLLLAATLNFLWTHMWAMVAFWTVRAHSFYDLAST